MSQAYTYLSSSGNRTIGCELQAEARVEVEVAQRLEACGSQRNLWPMPAQEEATRLEVRAQVWSGRLPHILCLAIKRMPAGLEIYGCPLLDLSCCVSFKGWRSGSLVRHICFLTSLRKPSFLPCAIMDEFAILTDVMMLRHKQHHSNIQADSSSMH